MQEHKTIQEYLDIVSEQIRWKRARPVVTMELKHHLIDQRDAFVAEGCPNAEQMAVEEMGDPVEVGIALDSVHRPKAQWGLLLLTIVLALVGSFLRVWLTADWEYIYLDIDPLRTVVAFIAGCGALLGGYFLDYTSLARHAGKIYLGALLVGLISLYFSPNINNASYYTRYVVLCYPVVYAVWLYVCRGKGWSGVLYALMGGVPLAVLCMAAPYTLGILLLMVTGFVLFLVAASCDWFGLGKGKTLFVPLIGVFTGIVTSYSVLRESDRLWLRLENFLYPERDPLGVGYMGVVTKKVLALTQWIGEGGMPVEFRDYPYEKAVPECGADLFFTTVIHRLGWLPFLVLVAAFALLVGWILMRTLRQKSQFGKLLVVSVIASFVFRAVLSIALNLGYVLTSAGFPLLIGNLSMVLDMGMIGLVLSVFRGDGIAHNEKCFAPRKRLWIQSVFPDGVLISLESSEEQ
ncbi:MAG: FtsW/RodA/SpoVE family cell cycle protein [Oscillospiraceae bacterium]|nr:FtsW/RodA/SpoVE family cell cycle protein [Oscillospiraceae bacterium]